MLNMISVISLNVNLSAYFFQYGHKSTKSFLDFWSASINVSNHLELGALEKFVPSVSVSSIYLFKDTKKVKFQLIF